MRATQRALDPGDDAQGVSKIVARCDPCGEKVWIVGGATLAGMGFPPERVDVTLVDDRPDRRRCKRARRSRDRRASRHADSETSPRFSPVKDSSSRSTRRDRSTRRSAARWPRAGSDRAGICYGRVRDYLLGSTIVLADGTIARAGGMVVKNVAGYDMSRLYVGSFGTLGVLREANLKTIPLPPHARLFLAPLPERTRERACAQLAALRIRPAAAFWVDGFHHAIDGDEGPEGRILCVLEGSDALLERATLELRSALGRAGVPETRVARGRRARGIRARRRYVRCLLGRALGDVSPLSVRAGVRAHAR